VVQAQQPGHGVVGVDAEAGAGRQLDTVGTVEHGEGAAQRNETGVRNRGSGKVGAGA
jgi:hypothetical protein